MRRELGIFETAAVLSNEYAPFSVVAVLELEPGPSPDELERALAVLQRQHPLIGVRIVREGRRYFFESDGTPPIPLQLEDRVGNGQWQQAAERELNTRFDPEPGPLMRCTYLMPSSNGGPGELLLTFHHAVMDGVSCTRLLGQLVELLNGGVAMSEPTGVPAGEALPPAESLFSPAFRGIRGGLRLAAFVTRQVADEVSYRLRRRGCRRPPVVAATRCRPFSVRLSRDATSELVRGARRRRMSLNSALNAAMLRAVQRRLYDGEAVPLRYMTFANLRPYLDPPVSDRSLAGFISFLRYTVEVRPETEFWELAGRIGAQLGASVRRGDKFCSALMAERVMRASLGQSKERMAAVALSYSGAVRLDSRVESGADPEQIRVRGMHGFVSNFGIGPEYTAQARLFDGELLLDIVYLDSDMDGTLARTMADDILATLEAAGEASDP
jgi:hypothetical protein